MIQLRKQLLDNAVAMMKYAENELQDTTLPFSHIYERGFVYGYSDYNISFSYNPKTKRAEISINWYKKHDHDILDDGFVIGDHYGKNEDETDDFLTNDVWANGRNIQTALIKTQNEWSRIKEAISNHKEKENNIFNFKL